MLTYSTTLAGRTRTTRKARRRTRHNGYWPAPLRRHNRLGPPTVASKCLARYGPARRGRILARLAGMLQGNRQLTLTAALALVNRR
jgi:hypothetical protein